MKLQMKDAARRAIAVCLALAAVACSGPDDPTTAVSSSLARLDRSLTDDEKVAASLAAALSSPNHRMHLLSALQRSPLAQHKVSLATLLTAPGGDGLRKEFEAGLADAGASLLSEEALNSLHVWMPSKADRLNWKAAERLLVAAAVSGRAERAFSTTGESSDLGSNLRVASDAAVLLLEPAAITPRRRASHIAVEGASISSGDDGGALLVAINQSGDTTISFLDVVPSPLLSAIASSSSFNGVALKGLMMVEATDFGSTTNPLELRFRAKLRRTIDNSEIRSATLHVDGYNEFVGAVNLPIISAGPRPGSYVELHVFEEDGWWWNDDLGTYDLTVASSSTVNWYGKNFFFPTFQAVNTQFKCNVTSPVYGTFFCPWNLPPNGTVVSWREVNFNVEWLPYVSPPPSIGVTGPYLVQAGSTHQYSVNYVPGGTAPYSYRWYRDGVLVGQGASIYMSFPTPSTFHQIVLDVTDGNEYWQQKEFDFNVNTGQCDPGDPNCYESLRSAAPKQQAPPK